MDRVEKTNLVGDEPDVGWVETPAGLDIAPAVVRVQDVPHPARLEADARERLDQDPALFARAEKEGLDIVAMNGCLWMSLGAVSLCAVGAIAIWVHSQQGKNKKKAK